MFKELNGLEGRVEGVFSFTLHLLFLYPPFAIPCLVLFTIPILWAGCKGRRHGVSCYSQSPDDANCIASYLPMSPDMNLLMRLFSYYFPKCYKI